MKVVADSQHKFPPKNSVKTKLFHQRKFRESDHNILISIDLNGKILGTPGYDELKLIDIVAAHCGLGGHRGYTTTCDVIKEKLTWPTIDVEVLTLVQGCLVCKLSDSGSKFTRLLGQLNHANKVGEILHFDYMYIGESKSSKEHILLLKDDLSGYVFQRAYRKEDAETTADVLMDYFLSFTTVLNWLSDQGTHFKNEVMSLLAKSIGAMYRFSTACVPWSNETIESVCKQVMRVLRALGAEFKVPETE